MFPNAKIILGIRKKELIIKSLYSESIKQGWSGDKKEIEKILNIKYNFDNIFKLLYKLFESNKIYIYPFEDFRKNKHECIKGICNFIGVPIRYWKIF